MNQRNTRSTQDKSFQICSKPYEREHHSVETQNYPTSELYSPETIWNGCLCSESMAKRKTILHKITRIREKWTDLAGGQSSPD
jgi:hypothetical protein